MVQEINEEEECNYDNDINNEINNNFNQKNFIIEMFEIIYISKKKQNKDKKVNVVKIFYQKRPFIFPMKKKLTDCFLINITKQKEIEITTRNFQGMLKSLIIMSLFLFMWFCMAVFINNLVEKYGSSTFSVCILPIFLMFFVKLIVTANVQFFIMAVVLKYKGKAYLNIVKKPPVDKIIFSALVHPMALDHYESILFYREYLRYYRFKDI